MDAARGRDVVVVAAVRTPIGRGHPQTGYYRDTHPNELLGACYRAVVERAGIDAADVDDVVVGCVQQLGEQSWNVARNAWLQAGLPIETPATTVDRQCGSGQQAINFAAAQIAAGVCDVVIGAGVEHLGHLPLGVGFGLADQLGTPFPPALMERHDLVPQGISAELVAARWSIPRAELDALAVRSHRLAQRATEAGRFAREILPLRAGGDVRTVDQGIRPDTSLEALAALKPVFEPDGGVVTAGTSSQISDGAAAVLLMSRARAAELGCAARARIIDQATVGVDPVLMLTGPIPATRALLERNALTIDDVDLFEVNEAFAPVVAAWQRELAPDMERVNVNGGAIALGHPLGASGARLLTTLLHELERADLETGLVTMCCGGGLGTGTLIARD